MKTALVLALLCAVLTPAMADAISPTPPGWQTDGAGGFVHVQSGMRCQKTMGGFTFTALNASDDPLILGICDYSGPGGMFGHIRVRKYAQGAGDSPAQDATLFVHPDRDMVRMARGPADGPAGSAVLILIKQGYLVDCFQTLKQTQMVKGDWSFTGACVGLPPG